jgi:predicted nuclease of predicted toxin-antitoxin system
MAWQRLKVPRSEPPDWKQTTRFLVDEDVDVEAVPYLRAKGFNAVSVEESGLKGRCDEDVLAFAWREKRVLLTLDHDYENDRRFPEHRNPGVVILSGGSGDSHAFGSSFGLAMAVSARRRRCGRKRKSPSAAMVISR